MLPDWLIDLLIFKHLAGDKQFFTSVTTVACLGLLS